MRFVMIGKLDIPFVAICITVAALASALLWANAVPVFFALHPHAHSIAPLSIVSVVAVVMLHKNRQRA